MTDAHWEQVKDLLHQALQLSAADRDRLLDGQSGVDDRVRREVRSLLAANADARSSFLRTQAAPLPQGLEFASGLEPGQVFEQRYLLVRELGEGGMGQVWLAEQLAPVHREVAIKLIRAGMYDQQTLQRFRAERQSLAMMDHPSIAKVFEAGSTAQGQPYFVMQYVPGLAITQYCDDRRLTIAQRVELFIRACEAVQHAHQKAIIHRDLKPANILVVEVDGVGIPRIIDFGLARPVSPGPERSIQTRLGYLVGTPGYMSPEQVDPTGQDIDTRSDVYSLGAVLYALISGTRPFAPGLSDAEALNEWLRRLRDDDPPHLSDHLNSAVIRSTAAARATDARHMRRLLRGDLDWIVCKALSRDREQRYDSPAQLAEDLRRYLRYEPVTARPASSVYKLRRFARRHRIVAGIALMAVFSIIAVVIAGLLAVGRQHEAEYQTRQALQAQSRVLTEVAAERLREGDVAGAQRIALEVLTDPRFASGRSPQALSVFQEARAADAQRLVLTGHRERVFAAAYAPDGGRIATASGDGTVRIWDAATGVTQHVLKGHTERVFDAAWSPDGNQIVSASGDQTARVWNALTGEPQLTLTGHSARVDAARYSPAGDRIVTASWDHTGRIWDARTGAPMRVLSGHSDVVYSAAYSGDGHRIVTASQDKTARVWDAATGAPLFVLSGHGDYVACAAFSPDGSRIVTASADRTARIWDAHSGVSLAVLSGHGDVVYGAAFSPDGLHVITASWDRTARIWDASSGVQLAVLSGHTSTLASAVYAPNGARIVTASQDGTARVWDARLGGEWRTLAAHRGAVHFAAWSNDGARIVTSSDDQTARIWDAGSGVPQLTLTGHTGAVGSAVFSLDGTRILTASQDKTARLWDAHTGIAQTVLNGHTDRVYAGALSDDGQRVATASRDKTVRIWDAGSGSQLEVLSGHRDRVYFADWSHRAGHLVTASRDRTARIWDPGVGRSILTLAGHTDQVATASYSADDSQVVTASADGTARIWDARSGKTLVVLSGHNGPVTSAQFSADGRSVVTSSEDHTARIWDARSGEQLAVLRGHGASVNYAAYSPDGSRIVTASDDHSARIWDARLPADLGTQIRWSVAAQFESLSEAEREQFALPADLRVRRWPSSSDACDQAAGAPYDPDRVAAGVMLERLDYELASSACTTALSRPGHAARIEYEMGRTLLAHGDFPGAQRQFEVAVKAGYRAARDELAGALLQTPGAAGDSDAARALYENAWQQGVTIAAYHLGALAESDTSAGDPIAQALVWYQRGATAGDPNSLAQLAVMDEREALRQTDAQQRDEHLLLALAHYSAAAEHARRQGWPDEMWRAWRYRRASLARILADERRMPVAAETYDRATLLETTR